MLILALQKGYKMSDTMKEWEIKLLAVFVTLTIFVMRFSLTKGLLMNGFLLLLCIFRFCFLRKQVPLLSDDIKGYSKAFAVYFICILPSIIFSDLPINSFLRLFFSLFQYGCFVAIILLIRRRKYLIGMLSAFFLFSGFDCLWTLVQLVGKHTLDNRGYGFGIKPLFIADIMCMLLPIALVILMDMRFASEIKLRKSAAFATLGIVIGLLCNKSRGAWLTELIVVPFICYRYLKQNRKYLAVFVLVILGMVGYMVSNPQYVERIYSITNFTTDRSNADRIWTWKSAKMMIRDYPLTGTGFGLFADVYVKGYKFEQETQNLTQTHNNFIQVTVETGVIGIMGFLYFIGYSLYTSLTNYRKERNPYDLLIFVIFLAHVCLFGQIDSTIWNSGMQPFFLFLMAILLCLKAADENRSILG